MAVRMLHSSPMRHSPPPSCSAIRGRDRGNDRMELHDLVRPGGLESQRASLSCTIVASWRAG